MRLFVAAELPDELLEALSETSALLRGSVRGRYVGPDLFHVTLAFLGSVAGSRIDSACRALDMACAEVAPSCVELGELGSFGRRNTATLWQGFSQSGNLPQLAERVRSELLASGFEFDTKKFTPHVTLMRKADLTSGALPLAATASGVVEHVTLFSSDLSGDRPVYTPQYTVTLS